MHFGIGQNTIDMYIFLIRYLHEKYMKQNILTSCRLISGLVRTQIGVKIKRPIPLEQNPLFKKGLILVPKMFPEGMC